MTLTVTFQNLQSNIHTQFKPRFPTCEERIWPFLPSTLLVLFFFFISWHTLHLSLFTWQTDYNRIKAFQERQSENMLLFLTHLNNFTSPISMTADFSLGLWVWPFIVFINPLDYTTHNYISYKLIIKHNPTLTRPCSLNSLHHPNVLLMPLKFLVIVICYLSSVFMFWFFESSLKEQSCFHQI